MSTKKYILDFSARRVVFLRTCSYENPIKNVLKLLNEMVNVEIVKYINFNAIVTIYFKAVACSKLDLNVKRGRKRNKNIFEKGRNNFRVPS